MRSAGPARSISHDDGHGIAIVVCAGAGKLTVFPGVGSDFTISAVFAYVAKTRLDMMRACVGGFRLMIPEGYF
jgi:hypothetical protein